MASNNTDIVICNATRKILFYSLIWPNEDQEMNPGKKYYFRILLFISVTIPWTLSVFVHLVMTLKENIDVDITEDFAFSVAFCGIYYTTFNYVRNQHKVALLLKDLSNFEKFGQPPGFEQTEKRMNFLSKCFFGYTFIGIINYNSIKLLQKSECQRRNPKDNCGFFTSAWTPFNINYFPVYHLLFIYIFVCGQMFMKLVGVISFNLLETGQHIILRINHLNIMISECFDDANYETCRRKLGKCLEYHNEILDFATRLDECFSAGMFAHLTITGVICGSLEKQFVDGNKLCAAIHFCGWIIALFIACVGGQTFINASNSIPEAIWTTKWYNADTRLIKDLSYMLAKAQRELRMSVGPFGFLSYELFVSVLKMSYSILAVLTS